jgi:hypothetical protein
MWFVFNTGFVADVRIAWKKAGHVAEIGDRSNEESMG